MITPATCRVIVQNKRALQAAADLGAALRQLRTVIADCDDYELRPVCLPENWNAALDTAIRDVAEEWGIC
jgi:hypothetical protein